MSYGSGTGPSFMQVPIVKSIRAGEGLTVDASNPEHPVIKLDRTKLHQTFQPGEHVQTFNLGVGVLQVVQLHPHVVMLRLWDTEGMHDIQLELEMLPHLIEYFQQLLAEDAANTMKKENT